MPLLARLKRALHASNRGKFKAPWIVANVGYDVIYTLVMLHIFGRYGIDRWLYVGYIAVFSLLYAWATFELVGALVDGRRRRAYWCGTLAALAFLAPDLYLVVATHDVPWTVWAVLALYVVVTASAAVVGLRRKAIANRRAAARPELAQTK